MFIIGRVYDVFITGRVYDVFIADRVYDVFILYHVFMYITCLLCSMCLKGWSDLGSVYTK